MRAEEGKKTEKAKLLTKTILAILFEVGKGTIKAFFPHPYYHTFCTHHKKRSMYQAIANLHKNKLIAKHLESDTFYLTSRGQKEAFLSSIYLRSALHQKKRIPWDTQWRMILFDVPEKKRCLRDYLRDLLKGLGCKELQKSIWVTPYPIPDFINEILWEERIKHHTRIITVKEIDYDTDLRKLFHLES